MAGFKGFRAPPPGKFPVSKKVRAEHKAELKKSQERWEAEEQARARAEKRAQENKERRRR